ncbi:MAG: hypothetical protein JKY54_04980, partial [Flavobacteriales bacterium]|nr:hypothetical protein [Flavobacteriales bacterium]
MMRGVKLFYFLLCVLITNCTYAVTVDKIVHKKISCASDVVSESLGEIQITPTLTGGTITYLWTGPNSYSSTSQDIASLADAGIYNILVTKTGSKGVTQETLDIALGYETHWTNFVGIAQVTNVANNGVDAKNTATNGWYRGAAGANILASSIDGWIECKPTNSNTHRMFGLSNYPNIAQHNSDLDYGIYLKNNGDIRRVISGSELSIGSYTSGDLIRVSREGQYIRFYKNGVELTSGAYNIGASGQNLELVPDCAIYTSNGLIENLGCSFRGPIPTEIEVQLSCGQIATGSIQLDPCGSSSTYLWSAGPGDIYSIIDDLSIGHYSVSIYNPDDWVSKKFSSCGYGMVWREEANVSTTSELITKTGVGVSWDAGAKSEMALSSSTDGWVEWFIDQTDKQKAIGFSITPSGTYALSGINHGFIFYNDGTYKLIYNGAIVGSFETYRNEDVFRVERSGTTVSFIVNDYTRYAPTVSATDESYVQASIYNNGGSFNNVNASYCLNYDFYSLLKKELDAEVVEIEGNILRFYYEERYTRGGGDRLEYKIRSTDQTKV